MEDIYMCKCGFKCATIQLYKTDGQCPKCGKPHPEAKKYGGA